MFTIFPSHGERFMMIPSTSNLKGIFCSFLMPIFCEKSGCFTLPGSVCMCACVRVCAHMTDEVFGNWRAGLIITDIFPVCFETQFQLGVVCDASRCQSEREKMRGRGGWER